MSTLSIVTFSSAVNTALGDPLEFQQVTVSATSTQSAALTNPTPDRQQDVTCRLMADTDCFVVWGDDPTAGGFSDSIPLGSSNPEYFAIKTGHKVAVIQRT